MRIKNILPFTSLGKMLNSVTLIIYHKIFQKEYTELPERYHQTGDDQERLAGYSSLKYVQPNHQNSDNKTPPSRLMRNKNGKTKENNSHEVQYSCPDLSRPSENGYECDSSDNDDVYDYATREQYLLPFSIKVDVPKNI